MLCFFWPVGHCVCAADRSGSPALCPVPAESHEHVPPTPVQGHRTCTRGRHEQPEGDKPLRQRPLRPLPVGQGSLPAAPRPGRRQSAAQRLRVKSPEPLQAFHLSPRLRRGRRTRSSRCRPSRTPAVLSSCSAARSRAESSGCDAPYPPPSLPPSASTVRREGKGLNHLRPFISALFWYRLQILDLSYNHLGPDGAERVGAFLSTVEPGALAHLSVVLGFNKIVRRSSSPPLASDTMSMARRRNSLRGCCAPAGDLRDDELNLSLPRRLRRRTTGRARLPLRCAGPCRGGACARCLANSISGAVPANFPALEHPWQRNDGAS